MRSDRYRAGFGEFFCSCNGTESTRSHPPPTSYFKTAATEPDSATLTAAMHERVYHAFDEKMKETGCHPSDLAV
jgi:hypothetical protein